MEEQEMSFQDAINSMQDLKPGELRTVRIVAADREGVVVDLGLKSEGFIPVEEFGQRGIPADFTSDKEIQVVFTGSRTEGYYLVSYTQARMKYAWPKIKTAYENKETVTGNIVKKIKGGFIVDVGVDAFLPMSQVDNKSIDSLNELLNRNIKVLITELNSSNKSVVVSHRKVVDIERKGNAQKVLSTIKPDDIIEGTVTKLVEFGAFIDIGGGVEGLVHISDLSWRRIDKASEVVHVGDKVKVKVLSIDQEKAKISLGLKHLLPHPWDDIEKKYPVGSIVKGKVISLVDFGAFVELEPGVEGLVHVSELSWKEKVSHPKKVLKSGEGYEFKVLDVNRQQGKISLSLKKTKENPWEELKKKYPAGAKLKVKVTKTAPFGAFVQIEEGMEGLIPLQDMSWTRRVNKPEEIVSTGKEIDAVMMEVKPLEERALLSIKHLTQDPFIKYSVGKIVKGEVNKIFDFGITIRLEPGMEGFIHKNEISRERDIEPKSIFKMAQEVEAKVIRSDRKTRKIDLSVRKLEIEMEKELVKKYSNIPSPTLGQVLEERNE
ncbi:MAG: hypothetical protein A2297_05135 [Elusimicrobia bacterium RIFOXYB2_FULL_48_7]|nr:MAG: hypothetical protein A2297_05135 [Elusimicrobia bacterium RIFOXYB2_FULL_48_7]